jgi:hypothetical protein
MAGILDLLNSDLGKQIISGVAGSTNQDQKKTEGVLTMALPVLTKALQQNSATTEGADSLMGALSKKHDGSILNNLEDLFNGGVDNDVKKDGSKILGHVLGSRQQGVEQVIGQKTNLSSYSVGSILKVAAPIFMGMIGKQKKNQNVSSSDGLSGMLGNFLGGSSTQNEQSFLEKILDSDGDGSVVDDVAGMFLGGTKKKEGGIGDMLGGLFGK